jgi:hypothetical protein
MTAGIHDVPARRWFESARPATLSLPHLITALDAELIGKLTQLTKSKPGLWNIPAPFDEHDHYDNMRESAPLAAWGLPLNQGEMQALSPLVAEAIFGASLMFVDSAAEEHFLAEKAVRTGRRLETGAYVTQGYHELPGLPEIVEQIGWALIPIGPARRRALFVTSVAKADWIAQARDWCEREGRNFITAQLQADEWIFVEQQAPTTYRDNAIGHQIDRFLGDFETYFGAPDQSLTSLIEERLEVRRKLQQEVARLKEPPPSA